MKRSSASFISLFSFFLLLLHRLLLLSTSTLHRRQWWWWMTQISNLGTASTWHTQKKKLKKQNVLKFDLTDVRLDTCWVVQCLCGNPDPATAMTYAPALSDEAMLMTYPFSQSWCSTFLWCWQHVYVAARLYMFSFIFFKWFLERACDKGLELCLGFTLWTRMKMTQKERRRTQVLLWYTYCWLFLECVSDLLSSVL